MDRLEEGGLGSAALRAAATAAASATPVAAIATAAAVAAVASPPPVLKAVYAELKAGDVLLFDAKIFHFGGANTTSKPRQLLSWSFQKPRAYLSEAQTAQGRAALPGVSPQQQQQQQQQQQGREQQEQQEPLLGSRTDKIEGWTYHLEPSLEGKLQLKDFLPVS